MSLRFATIPVFHSLGRSKCFSCGKTLHWYELIPLFSFIFLGGKCSGCKSKISLQYPIVEFLTGILFALVFLKFGISMLTPFYLVVICLLIAIAIYDLRHKIIPDGMVFSFDAVAFLFLLFTNHFNVLSMPALLDLWAGPIFFAFFAFFWLVSGGRWMGLGDAKLALGVGWLLGISEGTIGLMLAFWIGAGVSIIILLLQRLNISRFGLTMKSEMPFAPFIILAFFIELFGSWNPLLFIQSIH